MTNNDNDASISLVDAAAQQATANNIAIERWVG